MRIRLFSVVAVLLFLIVMSSPVFACSMAGEGKHVGKQVTAVDADAGTFTIIDIQSSGPIQFSASKDLLLKVNEGPGPVLVSYEDKDGELIATEITY
ncbi:MAG: hypothetical protein COC05_00440 [Gammaproteobacteria bacterium]|nr:MAG: hypothetical protein COC05_00440 [Gammaproteobacteria bacterium]